MKGGKVSDNFYGRYAISLCKEISVINIFWGLHPTKKELRSTGKVSYPQKFPIG
jgi:hypothetical protein